MSQHCNSYGLLYVLQSYECCVALKKHATHKPLAPHVFAMCVQGASGRSTPPSPAQSRSRSAAGAKPGGSPRGDRDAPGASKSPSPRSGSGDAPKPEEGGGKDLTQRDLREGEEEGPFACPLPGCGQACSGGAELGAHAVAAHATKLDGVHVALAQVRLAFAFRS